MPTPPLLEDLLQPGLRVVFCGTALGAASARARAYYAGPGNRFWPTLHETGLTPRLLAPDEYPELLRWGIGLTDVCKVASGSDREIPAEAYDLARLAAAIAAVRPGVLAFTSKKAAATAFGLRATGGIGYGPQGRRVEGTPTWVLTSPSGAGRRFWSAAPWHQLAAELR